MNAKTLRHQTDQMATQLGVHAHPLRPLWSHGVMATLRNNQNVSMLIKDGMVCLRTVRPITNWCLRPAPQQVTDSHGSLLINPLRFEVDMLNCAWAMGFARPCCGELPLG